jgi:hypothetical protein
MRFHIAMDSLEKEVKVWRIAVISLLVLSICLCLGILKTSQKNPMLIERGCISKIIDPQGPSVTVPEVQSFVTEALKQRFNSVEKATGFLGHEQIVARQKEQMELSRQAMKQVVIVNGVLVSGEEITVMADRLISVGEIRSAFKFPLKVEIEKVDRTDSNPYGLILSEVKNLISDQKLDKGKDDGQ